LANFCTSGSENEGTPSALVLVGAGSVVVGVVVGSVVVGCAVGSSFLSSFLSLQATASRLTYKQLQAG